MSRHTVGPLSPRVRHSARPTAWVVVGLALIVAGCAKTIDLLHHLPAGWGLFAWTVGSALAVGVGYCLVTMEARDA